MMSRIELEGMRRVYAWDPRVGSPCGISMWEWYVLIILVVAQVIMTINSAIPDGYVAGDWHDWKIKGDWRKPKY